MSRSLLQDEFDIRRLLAQYCHLCDDGDFGTLLDRFVEDASFILGNRTISGRQELLRWFEKTQSPERRGKHITSNVVVRIDGDEATAASDFVFLFKSEGGFTPLMVGRYVDDLRYGGDQWRFFRRVAIPL